MGLLPLESTPMSNHGLGLLCLAVAWLVASLGAMSWDLVIGSFAAAAVPLVTGVLLVDWERLTDDG